MLSQYFSKENSPAISVAPPIPRFEHPQPQPGQVWVQGYWDWCDNRHIWVPGRWEPARRGYHWLPHRWVMRDGHWHLQLGGWERDADATNPPRMSHIVWTG